MFKPKLFRRGMLVRKLCSSPSMGYLDAQVGDAQRTAFRKAEKRYKHYKHSSTSARSSRFRNLVPPADLSDVLDFHKIATVSSTNYFDKNGITRVENEFNLLVLKMEAHPGFYFIPEALNIEEQIYWIKESLTKFPQPPNRTSHTASYGHIFDLWNRAQNNEVLHFTCETNANYSTGMPGHEDACISSLSTLSADSAQWNEMSASSVQITPEGDAVKVSVDSNSNNDCGHLSRCYDGAQCLQAVDDKCTSKNNTVLSKTVPMKALLRKLRWATLGLQFDWSKRAYDTSLPYRKISPKLSELASKLAKSAMNEVDFHAEAAIVNYFGQDDMLGGHLDDMEADWSKPIVSISFGCKAIFLLGGQSREEDPTAMFLRSGDVVLMAGLARGCFHGIPRIFVDPEESDLPDFDGFDISFAPFIDYIRTSRINLNIRQVF